jgi:hypothetical protein
MGTEGLGSIDEQIIDCVHQCRNKSANEDPRWVACFKSALYEKTSACMQEKCTEQMSKCMKGSCKLDI